MSRLKRGDLVWTLDQLYGIVEVIRGAAALLFLGTGDRVEVPLDRIFPVTPQGDLAGEADEIANFSVLLADWASGPHQPADQPDVSVRGAESSEIRSV